MRVAIVGLGRAGRRHAADAAAVGCEVWTVDPLAPDADAWDVRELRWRSYDWLVIATPPSSHPRYLAWAASQGIPVLVEKPVCLPGAEREIPSHPQAWVALNYRYHSGLAQIPWASARGIALRSRQPRRPVPWGVWVDHAPHVLDLLRFFSGRRLRVEGAWLEEDGYAAVLSLQGIPVMVDDRIWDGPREVEVLLRGVTYPIEAEREMFLRMWEDLLGPREKLATLRDGMVVQDLLCAMQAKALAGELQRGRGARGRA